jgi:hypothetical protein
VAEKAARIDPNNAIDFFKVVTGGPLARLARPHTSLRPHTSCVLCCAPHTPCLLPPFLLRPRPTHPTHLTATATAPGP